VTFTLALIIDVLLLLLKGEVLLKGEEREHNEGGSLASFMGENGWLDIEGVLRVVFRVFGVSEVGVSDQPHSGITPEAASGELLLLLSLISSIFSSIL
jgi:hypothetical protein